MASDTTGFWDKWIAAPCKSLRWFFNDSPNLHIVLLLCAPVALMICTAKALRVNFEEWFHHGQLEPGCPYDKDVLETPAYRGWSALYILVGVTLLHSLVTHRNEPRRLLQVTFWLHFLVTTIICCLSTLSGWTTQPNWSSLIWNSNSPGKIVWLWLLVESGYWSWTYLGFYDDYYFHEDTRTVHDRIGSAVWTFTTKKTGIEDVDAIYDPYGVIFRPWRDIATRLSYIHLVDNAIHVIWLRYFHVDAPYTAYVNNSEMLTVLLFFSLAVYTYARTQTHVYFDEDVTGPLVDIKTTVPLPIRSASRDLFTFASQHHVFRIVSDKRQFFMIVVCLMTAGMFATFELHWVFEIFWILCFKVAGLLVLAEKTGGDEKAMEDLRNHICYEMRHV